MFGYTIVKIRSDNGSEFKNSHIDDYCDEHGIKNELSSTYTPQQNGVVERKNKTLITFARSMLDEYGTSEKGFGRRQLTPLAMLQIGSIFTGCLTRPPMSCWLEGSQMCHTFGFLDASATSTRK